MPEQTQRLVAPTLTTNHSLNKVVGGFLSRKKKGPKGTEIALNQPTTAFKIIQSRSNHWGKKKLNLANLSRQLGLQIVDVRIWTHDMDFEQFDTFPVRTHSEKYSFKNLCQKRRTIWVSLALQEDNSNMWRMSVSMNRFSLREERRGHRNKHPSLVVQELPTFLTLCLTTLRNWMLSTSLSSPTIPWPCRK